ncbi:MAG: hypothetical protein NVSMB6_28330 [Burkholderiaceae bacterium]
MVDNCSETVMTSGVWGGAHLHAAIRCDSQRAAVFAQNQTTVFSFVSPCPEVI